MEQSNSSNKGEIKIMSNQNLIGLMTMMLIMLMRRRKDKGCLLVFQMWIRDYKLWNGDRKFVIGNEALVLVFEIENGDLGWDLDQLPLLDIWD